MSLADLCPCAQCVFVELPVDRPVLPFYNGSVSIRNRYHAICQHDRFAAVHTSYRGIFW